jgi:hypothetical protein
MIYFLSEKHTHKTCRYPYVWSSDVPTQDCIQTYVHTEYIYTCVHKHIHAEIHVYIQIYMNTCIMHVLYTHIHASHTSIYEHFIHRNINVTV